MHMEKNVNYLCRWQCISMAIGFLWLTIGCLPFASAQQITSDPSDEALTVTDLYESKGKLLAEGKNTSPAGALGVKTYRIEEITLPKAIEVDIKGHVERVQTAIRLTVTGGPFPVRALPPVIWIDKVALEHVQESADLTALSTIIFDRSILKDGADISVSYGTESDSFSTLPEKLKGKAN